jgi:hypothetical protein
MSRPFTRERFFELPPLPAGRWRATIEDPRATWRIVKEVS